MHNFSHNPYIWILAACFSNSLARLLARKLAMKTAIHPFLKCIVF